MTTKILSGGDVITAPPTMQDPRFRRSALLITYHDLDGSLALCLNKPTSHTLEKISEEIGLETPLNFPLYWGGPVSPSTIWLLHSPEWRLQNTISISESWSLTSNEQMFWSAQDADLPRYFRFFIGLCSWQAEQLDRELRGDPPWSHKSSWLTVDQPNAKDLLEMPIEGLWENCLNLSSQQAVNNWL